MSRKRLNTYVGPVTDDRGLPYQFGPNDEVPDWAREKITNPDVWTDAEDEPEPVDTDTDTAPAPAPDTGPDLPPADTVPQGGDQAQPETPDAGDQPSAEPKPDDQQDAAGDPPPLGGAGSGRDAWAAYAEAQGVEVTEEMSRDDIVEAVRAAEGS